MFVSMTSTYAKGLSFVKTYDDIEEYRLDNGLKILLKQDPEAPLISWQVWYKVGSRNEAQGLSGIAHYLEHMMFKGTKLFEKGEIAQAIQLKGGVFNAFTGDDYTAYFENFSPEHLELAIKIEADRMRNTRLDKSEIELERSVIISELEGGENNPHNILYKTLKASAFQAHPYRNPVIGWESDLHNIDHEQMKAFYDRYYAPDNAVAILAGNFDKKIALDLIQKYFGPYKKSKNKRINLITQEPKQSALKRVIIRQEGYVKLLSMAFHIPEFNHHDTPALQVLADIGFGGTSSRLYRRLVDAGLATNVSGASEAGIDPSVFRITVALVPDTDISEVEKVLNEELELMKTNISLEELERSKARVEAAAIYDRDGAYEEALQIGYFEAISNDWTKYVDWVDTIDKVSVEDVQKVAQNYLKESNQTIVQLLPEAPSLSLGAANSSDKLSSLGHKLEQAYGAATVEPLDAKKLDRLLKITKPKYYKNAKAKKLNLNLRTIKLDGDLKNTKFIFREDHSVPVLYIDAVFFAGSDKSFAEGKKGLANITASMLERGTLRNDKFAISEKFDFYGSELNFDAKKESVDVDFSVISKNLNEATALFKEILREPKFDPEELDKLKIELIAAIKQENDFLGRVTRRELNRLIYPKDHLYYSYSPEERIKAIESITIDEVRDFYQKYYNSSNLIVSVVGDVSEEKAKSLVKDLFADWNRNPQSKESLPPIITKVAPKDPSEKFIANPDKKQVEILMGHSGDLDRKDTDFYPLLIANYALGGSSLSSRLGTVVRDKNGLVYHVHSAFGATLGAGAFVIKLGCNPKNVRKAIEITKQVVQDFLKEGISPTELEATKSYLGGSFAARNLASNSNISEALSQMQIYDLGPEYIENYQQNISSIKLEDVNRAARKHIKPEKLNTVIAGPEFY
jgi:zinc protease